MTNHAYIDRGIITWTTCNPYTYKHVCGNEIELPKFESYPDGSTSATAECSCGKVLDFIVTNGREIRILERLMKYKDR